MGPCAGSRSRGTPPRLGALRGNGWLPVLVGRFQAMGQWPCPPPPSPLRSPSSRRRRDWPFFTCLTVRPSTANPQPNLASFFAWRLCVTGDASARRAATGHGARVMDPALAEPSPFQARRLAQLPVSKGPRHTGRTEGNLHTQARGLRSPGGAGALLAQEPTEAQEILKPGSRPVGQAGCNHTRGVCVVQRRRRSWWGDGTVASTPQSKRRGKRPQ
jgi:hypothetical protein